MSTANLGMPFAITLQTGSSLANKTGSWRSERPVYVDLLPPCNKACPAGENIQGWLYHAEEGDYESAWREIMVNNPLPAVMGRVCYHTCQTACNRAEVDEAVRSGDRARITEELGDLMFATAQWARRLDVHPEDALREASTKFDRRFRRMEALARARGDRLDDLDDAALDALWNEAKKQS